MHQLNKPEMYPKSFNPDLSTIVADGNFVLPFMFPLSTPLSDIITYTKSRAKILPNGRREYSQGSIAKLTVDVYPDVFNEVNAIDGFPFFELKTANPLYQFHQDRKSIVSPSSKECAADEKEKSSSMDDDKIKRKRFCLHEFAKAKDLVDAKFNVSLPCKIVYDSVYYSNARVDDNIHFVFTATSSNCPSLNESQKISEVISVITKMMKADKKYKDYTLDRIWMDTTNCDVQITIVPLNFYKKLKEERKFMKKHMLGKFAVSSKRHRKKTKSTETASPRSRSPSCPRSRSPSPLPSPHLQSDTTPRSKPQTRRRHRLNPKKRKHKQASKSVGSRVASKAEANDKNEKEGKKADDNKSEEEVDDDSTERKHKDIVAVSTVFDDKHSPSPPAPKIPSKSSWADVIARVKKKKAEQEQARQQGESADKSEKVTKAKPPSSSKYKRKQPHATKNADEKKQKKRKKDDVDESDATESNSDNDNTVIEEDVVNAEVADSPILDVSSTITRLNRKRKVVEDEIDDGGLGLVVENVTEANHEVKEAEEKAEPSSPIEIDLDAEIDAQEAKKNKAKTKNPRRKIPRKKGFLFFFFFVTLTSLHLLFPVSPPFSSPSYKLPSSIIILVVESSNSADKYVDQSIRPASLAVSCASPVFHFDLSQTY
jgi:mRNA-degrading endonuclease YafQ of YafQ-DinJ toxin-antitoxin module